MNPARRRADRFSYVFEKSDHVVVRSLFDFQDLRNRKSRPFSNFCSVLLWDLAQVCHRLAGEHLNLQPDLEFACVRPDSAHVWPGVTVDHCITIKATDLREKCFVLFNAALYTSKMTSAVAHGAKTSSTLKTAHYGATSRASLFFRSSSEAAAGQKNRSSDQILERLVKMPIRTGRRLADLCAQEASVVVQSHLAAGKKIGDRCHR